MLAKMAVLLDLLLLPAVLIVNTLANETRLLYGWLNDQSSGGGGNAGV